MNEPFGIQIRATDLELQRAIDAYIPILECAYQLARGLPFHLPAGYTELGRVQAESGQVAKMARAQAQASVAAEPEARAMAAATAFPDLFGFVLREESTGAVLVAIRGTLVVEEWLRNFTAVPAEYSFLPQFGTVHLGFRIVYAGVRESIHQGLAGVAAGTRITLIGHSLGGALATLAAPDIKRNLGRDQVDMCTFGCPRVGRPDFRQRFNADISRCFRVTNQFDIVPHVPTILTGWMHVGEEVEVDGNLDNAHSLTAYLAGLHAIAGVVPGLTARTLEPPTLMGAVVP